MLYSYIFKTETRVFLFLIFCNTATFAGAFNFLVKINDILKRISLKESQFTGVCGYTYMKL
jgi:hypothetical protein